LLQGSSRLAVWGQDTRKRIRIIPYAIEIEDYKYDVSVRGKYRKLVKLQEDDYVIGHMRRFAYQKNHEIMINAFSKISNENDRAKLFLIGVGELQEAVRRKVY